MKLQYDEGPDRVNMGAAGEFRRGEAREVPDELAAGLLKKTTICFSEAGHRECGPAKTNPQSPTTNNQTEEE